MNKTNPTLGVNTENEDSVTACVYEAVRPWNPFESDEIFTSGGTLMAWLLHEAHVLGHSIEVLASRLGTDTQYLSELSKGTKRTAEISDKFAVASASYLGVPPILVKVASGQVKAADFLCPTLDNSKWVAVALRKIQSDPVNGALLPEEVFSAPEAVQHFIIQRYQEATGQQVLSYRSLPMSLQLLQRMALIQEDREREISEIGNIRSSD
jgi:hypothetical protein